MPLSSLYSHRVKILIRNAEKTLLDQIFAYIKRNSVIAVIHESIPKKYPKYAKLLFYPKIGTFL